MADRTAASLLHKLRRLTLPRAGQTPDPNPNPNPRATTRKSDTVPGPMGPTAYPACTEYACGREVLFVDDDGARARTCEALLERPEP
eukprot:scaffold130870_cov75-Phaeocystis_antarctica.AAC.1